MESPIVNICVGLDKEARSRLDAVLRPPRNNAARTRLYQEWATQKLYEALELSGAEKASPFGEFHHVPTTLPQWDRRIIELYRDGMSLNRIATTLNSEGIPSRRGGQWRHRTVQLVLDRIRKDYPVNRTSGR